MRRFVPLLASALFVAALAGLCASAFLGACNNNDIGAPCILNVNIVDGGLGKEASVATTAVNSTSLDCPARLCLHFSPGANGSGNVACSNSMLPTANCMEDFCTAPCGSDSDCNPSQNCKHGYRCIVPLVVGPSACKKMCVCADRLALGADGGVVNQPPPECK